LSVFGGGNATEEAAPKKVEKVETTEEKDDDSDDRKRRFRERNRVHARLSRLKKKQKVEAILEENEALTREWTSARQEITRLRGLLEECGGENNRLRAWATSVAPEALPPLQPRRTHLADANANDTAARATQQQPTSEAATTTTTTPAMKATDDDRRATS